MHTRPLTAALLAGPEGRALGLPVLLSFACQVAEGMSYLEERRIVHRDLAARNVLVGDDLACKVADFGLARLLKVSPGGDHRPRGGWGEGVAPPPAHRSCPLAQEDIYSPSSGCKIPVKWTAPEAANYRIYSPKSDVWSFGVLLYEVFTHGQCPYEGGLRGGLREEAPLPWRPLARKGAEPPGRDLESRAASTATPGEERPPASPSHRLRRAEQPRGPAAGDSRLPAAAARRLPGRGLHAHAGVLEGQPRAAAGLRHAAGQAERGPRAPPPCSHVTRGAGHGAGAGPPCVACARGQYWLNASGLPAA